MSLTHQHLELFHHFEIFSMDISYISSNLLKKTFATWHHAVVSTTCVASCFMTFVLRHAHKSKFWEFLDKKVMSLGFSFFNIFRLSIFFFSYLFAEVGLLLGLLLHVVQEFLRKQRQNGKFLPWSSQVYVKKGNFIPSLSLEFLSNFVHISCSINPVTLSWVLLKRSTWVWCQFWSKVMTSEVEQRATLVTAGYSRHSRQWGDNPSIFYPHTPIENFFWRGFKSHGLLWQHGIEKNLEVVKKSCIISGGIMSALFPSSFRFWPTLLTGGTVWIYNGKIHKLPFPSQVNFNKTNQHNFTLLNSR